MTDERIEQKVKALEVSFYHLLKSMDGMQGGLKAVNAARREAVSAAKVLDAGDGLLPAQVEAIFSGVNSDRLDRG